MTHTQFTIVGALLAGVVATGSWAVAIPAGVSYIDEMSRTYLGAKLYGPMPEQASEIPVGAILIPDENGVIQEVLVDQQTAEIQQRDETMHALQ